MKGIILDIDGVLRRGNDVIVGSVEAVDSFIHRGMKVCYLTNNSTRSRETLMRDLERMGFPRCEMVSSAQAAAVFINRNYGLSRCLVVGEEGLVEELEKEGHKVIISGEGRGAGPLFSPSGPVPERREMDAIKVDNVVAGLDRYLTYTRITDALWCIRNGARFIATNTDPTLPYEDGKVLPGAGTTISAIRRCSGVDPIVVGKPEKFSTELALDKLGLEASEVLVVGDRPDTDIAAGIRAGCKVAMVLTGDVGAPEEADHPIYQDLISLSRDDQLFE